MLAQASTAAIVRQIARYRALGNDAKGLKGELHQIGFAIAVLCVLGIGSSILIHFYGNFLLSWLNVPENIWDESKRSLMFMEFAIPLILLSSIFPSILRGREQFGPANIIKVGSVAVRIIAIVLVFEFFQEGIFPFVVIRTSSIIFEGIVGLLYILAVAKNSAAPSEPRFPTEYHVEGQSSQHSIILVLMFYALGNILALEMTKIGAGKFFGLAMLGVLGAALQPQHSCRVCHKLVPWS